MKHGVRGYGLAPEWQRERAAEDEGAAGKESSWLCECGHEWGDHEGKRCFGAGRLVAVPCGCTEYRQKEPNEHKPL